MNSKLKRLLPVLTVLLLISALVAAFTVIGNAADYSATLNSWFKNADSFNTKFTGNGNTMNLAVTAGNDGSIRVTTGSASGNETWFPAAMAAPVRLSNLDGAQVKFKLDNGFNFGNYNAFNGCVCFAWANALRGVDAPYVNSVFTPNHLQYNRYLDVGSGSRVWGGLGPQLKDKGVQGFSVTLFPNSDGTDIMSRHASFIEVYCTNGQTYAGSLSVDLSQECEIAIRRASGSSFTVRVNGNDVCTINTGFADTTAGLNCLTAWTSFSNNDMGSYRTNFSITEMNNFTAAAFPTAAYDVFMQISALPEPAAITTNDEDAVNAARSAYESLSDTMKTWIPEDTAMKLALCEAAFQPSTGYALLDDSTDPIAIASAVSSFASGSAAKMTVLDGSALLTPVTVKSNQTLIINNGASAASVSGRKGAKLEIAPNAVVESLGSGKIYFADDNNAWQEAVPSVFMRGATILRAGDPLSLANQSLKFGASIAKNAVSSDITDYGIIYLPDFILGNGELELTTPTAAIARSNAAPVFVSGRDNLTFTGSLNNIPKARYGLDIAARPFITYGVADDSVTIYGEKITRSINTVWANIINGGDIFVGPSVASVDYPDDYTAVVTFTDYGEFLKTSDGAALTGFQYRTQSGSWKDAEASITSASTVTVTSDKKVGGVRYTGGNLVGGTGIAALEFTNKRSGYIDEVPATSFTVSKFISDDMIVQRNDNINIWGFAPASQNGKFVYASFSGLTGSAPIEDGKWKITLDGTLPANSNGQTLTVYGDGVSYTYSNILVGDIYYIVGQSNVYYPTWVLLAEKPQFASLFNITDSYNIRLFRNSSVDVTNNPSAYPALGSTTLVDDIKHSRGWQKPSAGANDFSAVGYKFATEIYEQNAKEIPIGMIQIDASGYPLSSFMPNAVADYINSNAEDDLHTADTLVNGIYLDTPVWTTFGNQFQSRWVYNQLIYPTTNAAVAGLVWYQGESDFLNLRQVYGANNAYVNNFAKTMTYYREHSGNSEDTNNFPVYVVELPSCYNSSAAGWAYIDFGAIRSDMGDIPNVLDNCYFAASSDLWSDTGYANNIHPYCKPSQSYRLGQLAMAVNYGKLDINNVAGPQVESVTVYDSMAIVKFKYVGSGLKAANNQPNNLLGFEVFSGGWANALNAKIISNDEVAVYYSQNISGVRYNAPTSNFFGANIHLCSSTNVPAISFTKFQFRNSGLTNNKTMAASFTVSSAFGSDMVVQRDKPLSVWGWAPASENGKYICVTFKDQSAIAQVENGEWKATFDRTFPVDKNGTPLIVWGYGCSTMFTNVLVGDVYYVMGQSNCYWSMQNLTDDLRANNKLNLLVTNYSDSQNIRLIRNSSTFYSNLTGDVAQGTTTLFPNVIASPGWQKPSAGALAFSAIGYQFAYHMQKNLDIPIGMIEIDASGYPLVTFAPNELNDMWGMDIYDPSTGTYGYRHGTVMKSRFAYNQQLYPFINFCIKGIIWYQGESDNGNTAPGYLGNSFKTMFRDLITYYRSHFGNSDFPVYMFEFPACWPVEFNGSVVSYLPFGPVRAELGVIPTLLDDCYVVPSSDMWLDTQWWNNAHPYCKAQQAERLAAMVIAQEYGHGDMNTIAGPQFQSVTYNGNSATITFKYVGSGLQIRNTNGSGNTYGLDILTGSGNWIAVTNPVYGTNTITINADQHIYGVRYHANTEEAFPYGCNICSSSGVPMVAFADY